MLWWGWLKLNVTGHQQLGRCCLTTLHCPNALSKPPSAGHWKKRGCNAPAILSLGKRFIFQPYSFLSRAANSFPANPTTRFWFSLSQCQISEQHPELIPHWLQRFYYQHILKGIFRSKSGDSLRKRTWSCSASKQDVFQSGCWAAASLLWKISADL